jgi:FHS family L-fucose permease-like MFS transporter
MPKLMGHIADLHGMSAGFIIPLICFVWVAGYSLLWSKLSGSAGVLGLDASKGH